MSDAEDFLTSSIDDYLLSLADGIFSAQRQLSQLRVPGPPGQPPTTYFLPKVEFELKLSFEMARRPETGVPVRSGSERMLMARTITPASTGAQDFRAEAASVIRGAFVAVPADGGKPMPMMRISLFKMANELETGIVAQVNTTIGDPVPGIEVHFNVDRDASLGLNKKAGIEQGLKTGTELTDGVIVTNAEGRAVSILKIDPGETAGAHVIVVVDALGVTETLIYRWRQ